MSEAPEQLLREARAGDAATLGRLLEQYRRYLALIANVQIGQRLRGAEQAGVVFRVAVEAVRCRGHVTPCILCRSCARARIHSFSTLSRLRPMRRPTSGNVSPSRWRSTSTSR